MRSIFNIVAILVVFVISFAGMMATQVGIYANFFGLGQKEIEADINALVAIAILVSGFVAWGIYEQELK